MSIIAIQPSPQASLSSTGSGRPDPSVYPPTRTRTHTHTPALTFQAKCPLNAQKLFPAEVTYHWRSAASTLPPQEKGRFLWAGSSSHFYPRTACTKAFPPKPGLKSAFPLPPSIPNSHLKPPTFQAEPLLVLHPAHTPIPDTCAGRELSDLAGTREAASL